MAAALRVEIVSRETIKPSSPTPESHRIFKFSVLDQLAPSFYLPLVLFYSSPTPLSSSDRLRKSLSTILTHIYPLAGRIRDDFSIECNDDGVDFIEACVTEDISSVLDHPQIDLIRLLLPCDPQQKVDDRSVIPMLIVKVNHFACGGMAIAVCIRHEIADGSTAANFLKSWAAIARDGESNAVAEGNFILDCSSLFPPQDVGNFTVAPANEESDRLIKNTVFKRFLFDKSKVAAIRKSAPKSSTRMEAMFGLFGAAFISGQIERNEGKKLLLLATAVDLRKRMNPPLPPSSIGNIFHVTAAQWAENEAANIDYKELVKRLGESIKSVNDESVRKLHENGEYLNMTKYAVENILTREDVGALTLNSWCRFPLYEADFGWGKPSWVGMGLKVSNTVVFIDGSDGEGIEAWVALLPEDMDKLDQNLDFLAYVSHTQTL